MFLSEHNSSSQLFIVLVLLMLAPAAVGNDVYLSLEKSHFFLKSVVNSNITGTNGSVSIGKINPMLSKLEDLVKSRHRKKRTFTREELCDEALSYRDLPTNGLWHDRWTWRSKRSLALLRLIRQPREVEAQLLIYRNQFCNMSNHLYAEYFPTYAKKLEQWMVSDSNACDRTIEFNAMRNSGAMGGLGSHYLTMAMATKFGLLTRRVMRVSLGNDWYSNREKCAVMSDICWFQASFDCKNVSKYYAMNATKITKVGTNRFENLWPEKHLRMTANAQFLSDIWKETPPGPRWKSPKPEGSDWGHFWLSSQCTYFLLQPQDWLMEKVRNDKIVQKLVRPYVAIHVRHGDKWKEFSPIFNLSRYMRVMEANFSTIKDIFLLTDDPHIILETRYYPTYVWHWQKIPRWNDSYIESKLYKQADGFEEAVNAIRDIYLAVDAVGLICTLSSNFPRLIMRFQLGAYGRLNPVYSLDEWRKDVEFRKFPETELSNIVTFV